MLAVIPDAQAEAAASQLGFVLEKEAEAEAEPRQSASMQGPAVEARTLEPTVAELAQVPLYRLEEMTFVKEEAAVEPHPTEMGLQPSDLSDPEREMAFVPETPPLAAWSRLWPVLHSALQAKRPGQSPDLFRLLRMWMRGEVVVRIPKQERALWAQRAELWVDRSARLAPFYEDQRQVYERLRKCWQREGLTVRVLGREQQMTVAKGGDHAEGMVLDVKTPVLVLGDLGAYGSEAEQEAWKRTHKRLQRAGVRATALVPVPRGRWPRPLAKRWSSMSWERGRRAQLGSVGARRDAGKDEGVERLLGLVSMAEFVQLGLLRALRQVLPAVETDAGTEVELLRHPDVRAGNSTGMVLHARAAVRHRERFAKEEPAEVKEAVSRVLANWHKRVPSQILHAETLTWMGLAMKEQIAPPGVPVEALAYAERMAATLRKAGEHAELVPLVRRGAQSLLEALPDQAYRAQPILKRVWAAAYAGIPGVRVPAGVDPQLLTGEGPVRREPQWWSVRQVGDEVVFRLEASGRWPSAGNESGSPAGWMQAAGRHVFVKWSSEGDERQWPLEDGLKLPIKENAELRLRTDRCVIHLAPWPREPWATAAGRDRYGLWADASIDGIAVRFRYIPPGRFLMGSPESEAGRYDQEGPQHEVTWTQGYWLADAPCTQAVWERVMGENPSYFTSADRPAENVSWDDCQEFLKRLNESSPELMARLPSEAEWEHACRGGTPTATWVGDLEILGENNAPLLDEIAWYGGNSGQDYELDQGYDSTNWPNKQYPHTKAGTHEVRKKQANPHGLHDMLGNVYEWCVDMAGTYEAQAVTNPAPSTMGPGRVIRGGSWVGRARFVRAAGRYGFSPGHRADYLGFRLARGQGGWEAGTRSGPAGRGEGLAPAASALREAGTTPARSADQK